MIRSLSLALAFVAFATTAEAGTTWLGSQLEFPLPGRGVGDTQLGVDAGVTFTHMKNPHAGIGLDVIYHYWPASAGYQAAFDHHLRTTRVETLGNSPWAFHALQVTAHLKVAAPFRERYVPWAQVGGGAYHLDRNLHETRPAGTFAYVLGSPEINLLAPGWYGALGLDIHTSPHVALGLDATFHYVWSVDHDWSEKNDMPGFSAFTLGTHVLFGWE